MNNYEIHEKAQALADGQTAYSLARRVVELEEILKAVEEALIHKCEEQ